MRHKESESGYLTKGNNDHALELDLRRREKKSQNADARKTKKMIKNDETGSGM